jgi:hypothetical protein
MYDVFFIGYSDDKQFAKLKDKVITARAVDSVHTAKKLARTKMLWIVYPENEIVDDFNFEYDVLPDDFVYTHVFKNGMHYDGVALMPKDSHHGPGELAARFYINKKFTDITASTPLNEVYDIVFISYQEPDADENYKRLLEKFPRAKRVHGVKGIHQAHIEAAKICTTNMFFVVDGDAHIVDDYNFDYVPEWWNMEAVHVWRSINPINEMEYGYGGVKLFPTKKTIYMDTSKPDMTTSISNKFVAVKSVSNYTAFNTDPFNTWKSAFRECCKLSSKVIDRQKDDETQSRLVAWCTKGEDKEFGKYAIAGAKSGAAYGARHRGNIEALKLINDFEWLEERFNGEFE